MSRDGPANSALSAWAQLTVLFLEAFILRGKGSKRARISPPQGSSG